jgi:hypothetical protein
MVLSFLLFVRLYGTEFRVVTMFLYVTELVRYKY